ncbi:uncharacterized protein LOC127796557 [Diospyros lotus]|uniref:uncharacterized protein LOC127796557 n=1 Tax=Diospyros lotus TaxID=55363 RepID=UPI00224F7BCC|nr:uncharacterized protein LOC127796557 [Diospyros lotus]
MANERFLKFSDPFNPFRINNGDNPAAALVSDLLTNDNYVSWSQAVSRALRAKNKLGFINETISKPQDATDPIFEAWERRNDLVVSWLQNSDLASWATIGMGEVRDGLYHLLRFGVSASALVDVLPAFLHKDQLLSASVTHKDSTSDKELNGYSRGA